MAFSAETVCGVYDSIVNTLDYTAIHDFALLSPRVAPASIPAS